MIFGIVYTLFEPSLVDDHCLYFLFLQENKAKMLKEKERMTKSQDERLGEWMEEDGDWEALIRRESALSNGWKKKSHLAIKNYEKRILIKRGLLLL